MSENNPDLALDDQSGTALEKTQWSAVLRSAKVIWRAPFRPSIFSKEWMCGSARMTNVGSCR
jgi:hypothetical protein